MKQLLSITLLFSLTVLFTAISCKKQNAGPQLPPETQTGANTLGFKIDGKVYTASGKGGLLSSESVWGGGPKSDTAIDIGAQNSYQNFSFYISIKYSGNSGIHYTEEYPYTGLIQIDTDGGNIPTGSNTYNTTNLYKGKVNIKFCNGAINPLRTGTIVSGTFEMEAVNAEGKVIKLTDGRFDLGRFL